MSSDRWLTYEDAAAALNMTLDSVRHRARRERWGKKLNNAGKAIILVPMSAIPAPGVNVPQSRPSPKKPDPTSELLARIADLEARIEELRPVLEAERTERHEERERADHIAGELAGIARQFADEIAAAQSKIDAERIRADAERTRADEAEKRIESIEEKLIKAEDHARQVDAFIRAPRWQQAVMRRPSQLMGMFSPLSSARARSRKKG